ncbi:MAG: hypothetical protein FJ295_02275 [Planctomycetes bacterium]|nr:hypothetical protein [Planctomycetota bacterium]
MRIEESPDMTMESGRKGKSGCDRRTLLRTGLGLLPFSATGCTSSWFLASSDKNDELLPLETGDLEPSDLIGDVTHVWSTGMRPQKLESVALVTGLNNTGSDPPAGPQRQALIDEMNTHDVANAKQLLVSPTTSLVITIGYIPVAARKGDRFDIEVRTPQRSDTTSLRGGWLMHSRMHPLEQLGGVARQGSHLANCSGEVLIDAVFKESEDKVLLTRGRILGGAVALIDRTLGLVVRQGYHTVAVSTMIGAAINGRFSRDDHGQKRGCAVPKRDNFIELTLHRSYSRNIGRYIEVVRSIAIQETPSNRVTRIQTLEKKLREPATSRTAALQLEAIGKEGVAALRTGLRSPHREVRFYAAEALAYLDVGEGVDVLQDTAENVDAFRWESLTALSTLTHLRAYDALLNLMHVSSAETRYGAVRAIHERRTNDPLVRGETLGKSAQRSGFQFIVVKTHGEPMVHFSKSRAQEVVLFGDEMRLRPPQFLFAGPRILIKPLGADQLQLTRFQPGEEDVSEASSTRLVDLIPAIVRIGGDYSDVMQAIQQARIHGDLDAKVAIDALPRPNRQFNPTDYAEESAEVEEETESEVNEAFPNREYSPPKKGFFGRMVDWMIPTE